MFTVTVTLAPSVPGVNGFLLKAHEMVTCAGLELQERLVGLPVAPTVELIGNEYIAGVPAATELLPGVGTPNEKSHKPIKLNGSAFVFPFTESCTNTGTPPAQAASVAATLPLRLVGLKKFDTSEFPLKLIADCAVNPVPVAVSANVPDEPLAAVGLMAERL